jgi:hypothetical protein
MVMFGKTWIVVTDLKSGLECDQFMSQFILLIFYYAQEYAMLQI